MADEKDSGVSLELSGPMGLRGKLAGLTVWAVTPILLAVVIAMQVMLMWMMYADMRDRQARYEGLRLELAETAKRDVMAVIERGTMIKEQESTTWAIFQDEATRAQIRKRLAMPKALRERLQ